MRIARQKSCSKRIFLYIRAYFMQKSIEKKKDSWYTVKKILFMSVKKPKEKGTALDARKYVDC